MEIEQLLELNLVGFIVTWTFQVFSIWILRK